MGGTDYALPEYAKVIAILYGSPIGEALSVGITVCRSSTVVFSMFIDEPEIKLAGIIDGRSVSVPISICVVAGGVEVPEEETGWIFKGLFSV